MKRTMLLFLFVGFSLTGFACRSVLDSSQPLPSKAAGVEMQEPLPVAPTETPTPTRTPVLGPAFEAARYRDESVGFEFDYPAGWTLDGGEAHSRGSYVQFYSWDWKPGDPIEPLPAGGTILTVTNQLWDPKNDLEAFINQRKLAWDASGISILSEDRLTLSGDRPAAQFIIQAADGVQAFFMLTTNGENYLVLSGSGDLDLLAVISHSLRPIR